MRSWIDLARLGEKELAKVDVAEMNLICAEGLPGAETMDARFCLDRLDEMAEKVRWETLKYARKFEKEPWDYYYSYPYCQMLVLVTVLRRKFGVKYNPEKIPEHVPLSTADSFIFGIFQGDGGTCASLPVVYAAVGRRLGYPLKLVLAKGERYTHFFVRWHEPDGLRFNVEATGEGLSCPPDKYYRTGMYKTSQQLEEATSLLKSMTPRQDLAGFINERGWRFLLEGQCRRAVECFAWANGLMPNDQLQLRSLEWGMGTWEKKLKRLLPPGFPQLKLSVWRGRFPVAP